MIELLVSSSALLLVALIAKLHKEAKQDKENAKFDDILINQRNPLRNVARVYRIYLYLEKKGQNPVKVQSFKAELENRRSKITEDYGVVVTNLKEAHDLVHKLDKRLL